MTNKHDERVERMMEELEANTYMADHHEGYEMVIKLSRVTEILHENGFTTLTKEVREQTLAEVREGLKTMRPILWNDDPKRHAGNIIKYNTINEALQLLDTLENK